jgi:ABC-type transport system substrate-binding protein
VRITFGQRNPYFLEILANPRFKIAHPRHLMQPRIDRGEVDVTPLDIGLVGVGPFVLERYEKGSLVRVRRFERYWERDAAGNSLPYLDRIDYVIMPDPFTMDVAFRTGSLVVGGHQGKRRGKGASHRETRHSLGLIVHAGKTS